MALSDSALATIAPLRPSEIGDANALVCEAGWNQVDADWRIFLELGRAYGVRNRDGCVVATAATLPHAGAFAWISMVLVSKDYRRQGLATRLMRRCIDDLTADGIVPVLDATPDGREVYRALGFQDSWGYQRLVLQKPPAFSPAASEAIELRSIDDAIWPALCAYDAAAFGARREALIAGLRGRLPAAEHYALRNGKLVGFMLGRDGRTNNHLGPLIADDDAVAIALLRRALPAVPPPIYLDFADAKSSVREWIQDTGFTVQRPFTRMLLGTNERFDDVARTYAVAGPEFG